MVVPIAPQPSTLSLILRQRAGVGGGLGSLGRGGRLRRCPELEPGPPFLKPAGGAVSHCVTRCQTRPIPHHVSNPLPQSFVGALEHRTALIPRGLSRVPYAEQGTPVHVGLSQRQIPLRRGRGGSGGSQLRVGNALAQGVSDQAQAQASYTPLFGGHSRSIPQGMILDVQPLVKSLFCPIRPSPNGFFDFEAISLKLDTRGGGGGRQQIVVRRV